jgi:hypothetical protein
MLVFLLSVLFAGVQVMGGIALWKAISLVTEHVREHSEAGNSIFTHVIPPVFGKKKRAVSGERRC